jgi:pseudouridine synthase
LAQHGFGSRRHAETLIQRGRVTVNGSPAPLGTVVAAGDEVLVDGKPLPRAARPTYLIMHKPPGFVVTRHDPGGRPTVMDLLEPNLRTTVFPVGRLDLPSEGLLLLTNDGELANRLLHPRYGVIKTYLAWIRGQPTPDKLEQAAAGVEIEPGLVVVPASVKQLGSWPGGGLLEVRLGEGKKREVRRICEALGWRVARLKRVAFGSLRLGDLPLGKYRALTPAELGALRDEARS